MKKYSILVPLIGFLLVLASSCSQSGNGWKTLENIDYSVQYPSDWIVKLDKSYEQMDSNKISSLAISILSPQAAEGDKFAEKVSLLIQRAPRANFTLDYIIPQIESIYDTTRGRGIMARLKESVRKKANGMDFQEMITTNAKRGEPGIKTKSKEYIFVKKNTVYTLAFTAPIEKYDESIKMGDKILDSFRLK